MTAMTAFTTHHPLVQARDVMVIPAEVSYASALRDAAESFCRGAADAVLVRHDDGNLAGILTERDLVFGAQAEAEGHVGRAGEYMASRFITARGDDSLVDVLRRMVAENARRAVIEDEDGRTGLISVLMSLGEEDGS